MPFLGFIAAIVLAVLGLIGGVAAFGGAFTSTSTPAQAVITTPVAFTEEDSGVEIPLRRGLPIDLLFSKRWTWSKPRVTGPATVRRSDSSAYDAWQVNPTGPGTVIIRSTGSPGHREFKATIHVR